jgi:hemolysin III
MPVLFVGYVGGTIYHATRSHSIWLLLDFVPILILALITAFYCWRRLKFSYPMVVLFLIGLIAIPRFAMYSFLDQSGLAISLSYFILSLSITLPVALFEYKNNFKTLKPFLLALGLVLTALCFRIVDTSAFVVQNISIGTHWLWHSFGALGSHALILYLKKSEELVVSS